MKSLKQGQDSRSFISESHSHSKSKSKSKKYNPPKKTKQTGLTPKIKSLTQYFLKTSPNHQDWRQNQSSFVQSVRCSSKTRFEPPKKIASELVNLYSNLRKNQKITDQFGTSIPIIQQLRQTSKQEKNQKKQHPSNFLFSLDQEQRYITGELFKIKQDYVKFKQLVLSQVIKLQKQMHQIVQQINNKLQDALSKRLQKYPQSKIGQNIFKQLNQFNNPQKSKNISQDRSMKNIFKSINDTKNSFDKMFSKQSVKMQKTINKAFINKTVNFSSPIYQRNKEEEEMIQIQKSQQKHLNNKKSQKMLQKLFSAVTFIKQQMRDLSQLNRSFIDRQNFTYANKSTYDIRSQKKVKYMNGISQNQQNQTYLNKQVKKSQKNDWIFRNRVKNRGKDC